MSYSNMTPISTPSPEEMYKRYTSIDTLNDPRIDEVLKHAMTGGNPNFPGIYATMALDARNNNRAQAKFQQAQQQTQQQGRQPTIAENIINRAPVEQRLTQGMGSLPVDESTFHAAGGGMVAFSRGDIVEESKEQKHLKDKAAKAKRDAGIYRDGISSQEMRDMEERARAEQNYEAPRPFTTAEQRAITGYKPPVSPAGDGISSPEMNAMIDDASRRQNPTPPAPVSQEGIEGFMSYGQQQNEAANRARFDSPIPAHQSTDPRWKGINEARAGLDTLNAPTPTPTPVTGQDRVIGGKQHYLDSLKNAIKPVRPGMEGIEQARAGLDALNAPTPSGKKPAITMDEYNRLAAEGLENRKPAKKTDTPPAKKDLGLGGLSKDNKQEVAPTYESMLAGIQKSNPDRDISSEFANKIKQRMDADKDSDHKFKWGLLPLIVGAEMMSGESQFAAVNIGNALKTGAAAQIQEIQRKEKMSREDNRDLMDLRKFQATMDKGDRDTAYRMYDNYLGRLSEEKRAKLVSDTAILVGQGHDATQRAIFSIDRPENAAQKTAADYLTSTQGIRDDQIAALPQRPGETTHNAQVMAAAGRLQAARERSRAPSTAPSTAPSKNTYSDKDIAFTAKTRGMTEAEVRRQLGIQ